MEIPKQNKRLGIALMCAGMLTGVSIDASVKALAGDYSTAQIVFMRGLFAMPVALALVHREGSLRQLATLPVRWQMWRGLLTAGMTFGYFYGLGHVPLVTAMLIAHISPILIVLLAWPLLGERIHARSLGSVLFGFLGVVSIVQPTSFAIHPAILSILASALCWALLSLNNRQLSGLSSPAVLTFHTYPISTLVGSALCVPTFVVPAGFDWVLIAIVAVGSAITHWLMANAYRYAQAGAIAPFEYTALIWATLAGYLFWAEIPNVGMVGGGVLIIIGGMIALRGKPA